MSRKLNIAIFAILLTFVVGTAYGPNETTEKKEPDVEGRLMKMEKKIDELIKSNESLKSTLEEMDKQLDTIENLIRSRT